MLVAVGVFDCFVSLCPCPGPERGENDITLEALLGSSSPLLRRGEEEPRYRGELVKLSNRGARSEGFEVHERRSTHSEASAVYSSSIFLIGGGGASSRPSARNQRRN